MKTHLFRINRVSKKIPAKYNGQLAYFFDDLDNPLDLPKGLMHVAAHDPTRQVEVDFDPKIISLKKIQAYLTSIGLSAEPLSEKKRTAGETVLTIVLYPFLLIIGAIIWTVYHTHRLVSGNKRA